MRYAAWSTAGASARRSPSTATLGLEPGGARARDERVERGEPGGRLDAVRRALLAERAHELVDLGERLARDLLDRLDRRARARRVLLEQQARGAGLDEDHVHGVAGRVVQVAGDPRPLLGARETPLALGLPLGPTGLLRLGRDPLAALPQPVAGEPGGAPDERAEESSGPKPFRTSDGPTSTTRLPSEDRRVEPRLDPAGRRAAVKSAIANATGGNP